MLQAAANSAFQDTPDNPPMAVYGRSSIEIIKEQVERISQILKDGKLLLDISYSAGTQGDKITIRVPGRDSGGYQSQERYVISKQNFGDDHIYLEQNATLSRLSVADVQHKILDGALKQMENNQFNFSTIAYIENIMKEHFGIRPPSTKPQPPMMAI